MFAVRFFGLALVALAAVTGGCFNPSFKDDIACGPQESCPSGLACVDGVCRAGGGGAIDAPVIDAPVIDADVPDATVDATPVQCTRNEDCQNPTSRCQLPGTCDTAAGVCNFGAVDCSSMNSECSMGVCEEATGSCVAQPINEDQLCGRGDTCGAFGPCGDFDQVCDSGGTQSRTCTRNACQAGACVGTQRTDTAACTRVTEGVDCAADTVGSCGACGGFNGTCGESGSQTCTCTDFKCSRDVCTPAATSCAQSCSRDTDGTTCANPTEVCPNCAYPSVCAQEAPARTCTCNTFTCSNGSCATVPSSCTRACSRNTNGNVCGCVQCPAGEGGRFRACSAGTCSNDPTSGCGDC
jgi:hypothetical protein